MRTQRGEGQAHNPQEDSRPRLLCEELLAEAGLATGSQATQRRLVIPPDEVEDLRRAQLWINPNSAQRRTIPSGQQGLGSPVTIPHLSNFQQLHRLGFVPCKVIQESFSCGEPLVLKSPGGPCIDTESPKTERSIADLDTLSPLSPGSM